MPNWVYSNLEITGKPKHLHKLLKQIEVTQSEVIDKGEVSVFSFQKVIPRPIEKDEDWYNWNTENWGCKWDSHNAEFYDDDWESGSLGLNFETAWSPAEPVIQALAKEHKQLKFEFRFYDEGFAFYGILEYKKGKVKFIEYEADPIKITCDVYNRYSGDSYHHECHECGDWEMLCEQENTPMYCSDCMEVVLTREAELWSESSNTEGEAHVNTSN